MLIWNTFPRKEGRNLLQLLDFCLSSIRIAAYRSAFGVLEAPSNEVSTFVPSQGSGQPDRPK